MDIDLQVKLAVYRHFAATGTPPSPADIAAAISARAGAVGESQPLASQVLEPGVLESYGRLRSQRVLALDPDGASIRMAPPFSGVPTQHVVIARGVSYFANCAWDALGIPAALQAPATVHSRCEQSMEPLSIDVRPGEPVSADWLFHCVVPAAHWWDDIVFT